MYAVQEGGYTLEEYMELIAKSEVVEALGGFHPRWCVGISGYELYGYVVGMECKSPENFVDMAGRTPDINYWTGWALALYHWWSAHSFKDIIETIPVKDWMFLYHPLHTCGDNKVIEVLDEKYKYYKAKK